MAGGSQRVLANADRTRIGAAVQAAERATGLQLSVAVGETPHDARSAAERLFVDRGLVDRPAILVLVAPARREVEIVTSVEAKRRVSDAACADAIATMVRWFATGDLVRGLVEGVRQLALAAGAGDASNPPYDMPDVIG